MEVFKQSIKKANHSYKTNFVSYFVGAAVVLILPLIISIIYAAADYTGFLTDAVWFILGILVLVAVLTFPPLLYGLAYMGVKGTRNPDVAASDVFFAFRSSAQLARSWAYGIILLVTIALLILIVWGVFNLLGLFSADLGWFAEILITILSIVVSVPILYAETIYVMTAPKGVMHAISESLSIAKEKTKVTLISLLFIVLINAIICALSIAAVCGYLDFMGGHLPNPEELVFIVTVISLMFTLPYTETFLGYLIKDLRPTIRDTAEDV
ncbi:hypothetical protein [Methanolapillus ohkumae]|uniref:Uncharacterized protein n=1 Tax=Methanolapillus ohkumae TaxID=3028298 RepID=A0AA96V7J7_9EURY|nr:hypothetical protein MsAm2_10730 [Methanosarcinaceae archaeon Am2]